MGLDIKSSSASPPWTLSKSLIRPSFSQNYLAAAQTQASTSTRPKTAIMRFTANFLSLLAAASLAKTDWTPAEEFEFMQREREIPKAQSSEPASVSSQAAANTSANPLTCDPPNVKEFCLPAKFHGGEKWHELCKTGNCAQSERCIGSYAACKSKFTDSAGFDKENFMQCLKGKKPGPLPKDVRRVPFLTPYPKDGVEYDNHCGQGKGKREECVGTLTWCKDSLWRYKSEWQFANEQDCFLSRKVEKKEKLPFVFEFFPPSKSERREYAEGSCKLDKNSELCVGTMQYCTKDYRPFESREDCLYARTRPRELRHFKPADPKDPDYKKLCPQGKESIRDYCLGTEKYCEGAEDPKACLTEHKDSAHWHNMWDEHQKLVPDAYLVPNPIGYSNPNPYDTASHVNAIHTFDPNKKDDDTK